MRVIIFYLLTLLLLVSGCSMKLKPDHTLEQARVDYDLIHTLPEKPISYNRVRPILERRCVVCHGCYDAPCQLKLSSWEGMDRGANKDKVYNGTRFTEMEPTRLFTDARSTAEWRSKNFHTVLNESSEKNPETNLENSTLYQMLRLKQLHPQPRIGMLPNSFDLSLNRAESCPTRDEFDDYATKHPLWGMPYALPNLSDTEYKTLVQWLAQGATAPEPLAASPLAEPQIKQWEAFFNATGNKQRLVSRYLYEHLFHAHLHFDGTSAREFYRLVRSQTPPGKPVEKIASVRPTDGPGPDTFYYRLQRYHPSIVAKDHVVYTLSKQRMKRYRELFLKPDYTVVEFPPYPQGGSANPLKAFAAIPQASRYRFLLDDARFFIEGFIKGPVCRGQIALSVIEDHFWVVFADPDTDILPNDAEFIVRMADNLELPAPQENTINLLRSWKRYWEKHQRYTSARVANFKKFQPIDIESAMQMIWDGDGHNPNAALTIFRHFDSASVKQGLLGDYPETAWVIEYPQFERIHYLLVADFNVYGNASHQLTTRLYTDFLRMEGENNFLAFLPASRRKAIHDAWYTGVRNDMNKRFDESSDWLAVEAVQGYKTDDPQLELYRQLLQRVAKVAVTDDYINRCRSAACVDSGSSNRAQRIDREMQKIATLKGEILQIFPDVGFVRVKTGKPDQDLAYSLIHNKAYKHVSSIFKDEQHRDNLLDIKEDTLTVIRGLEGSYPNFFFVVDLEEIENFTEQATAIKDRKDYEKFVAIYGVRRTRDSFWEEADWFQDEYAREEPIRSGLFDLNRYQNR